MDKDIEDKELDQNALDEMCACGGDSEEDCTCDDNSEEGLVDESEYKDDEDKENVSESDDEDKDDEMDDLVEGLAKVLGVKKPGVAKLKEAFLTAVKLKTEAAEKRIELELKTEAREAVKIIKSRLEEEFGQKLNGYAKVVVTEWIKENSVSIKQSIEFSKNRKIVEGMRKLFSENAYTIKEGDEDVVDELSAELEDEKAANESLKSQNAAYRKILEAQAKKEEIGRYKLTESQSEKVYSLVESFPVDEKLKDRIKSVIDLIESSKPAQKPAPKLQERHARKPMAETLVESFSPKKVVKPQQDIDASSFLKDLLS
jgi:hypothetical protein